MENAGKRLKYLTIDEILRVAEEHEGWYRLLNENQLRYLVQMVGEKISATELFPTLAQKAAVYAHHIITGHIFLDGNKRIGMHCAFLLFELNGSPHPPGIDDSIIEIGMKIADGTLTDIGVIADHLESWVEEPTDEGNADKAKLISEIL